MAITHSCSQRHNFTFNFAQENLTNSQMTKSQIPFKTRKSQKLLGDIPDYFVHVATHVEMYFSFGTRPFCLGRLLHVAIAQAGGPGAQAA